MVVKRLHRQTGLEKRDQAIAARLKQTGVVGRFPDLMFFGIKVEVCCVERAAGCRNRRPQ